MDTILGVSPGYLAIALEVLGATLFIICGGLNIGGGAYVADEPTLGNMLGKLVGIACFGGGVYIQVNLL